MKTLNNDFTHELFYIDSQYYFDTEDYVAKIKNHFEEIYSIDNVLIAKTSSPYEGAIMRSIKVRGMVHLYGFKVENGGFFDSVNGIYYDESYPFFKNCKIVLSSDNEKSDICTDTGSNVIFYNEDDDKTMKKSKTRILKVIKINEE